MSLLIFIRRFNLEVQQIVVGEFNLQAPPVEFVFAPAERDVYSYEPTPKDIPPLGAKPGSGTFAAAGEKRLRS